MEMEFEIELRSLSKEDVDHVMTWVNDPEVVKNFQHFGKKFTREEELSFITKMIESEKDKVFSIFRKSNNVYVGQCGIHQIGWENRNGRLALIIKREYWNQGYGAQALQLLIREAFENLRLHKVWIIFYASNEKGLHLYKKLGFQQEGLLKEEYYWQGTYQDMLRFALINPNSNA